MAIALVGFGLLQNRRGEMQYTQMTSTRPVYCKNSAPQYRGLWHSLTHYNCTSFCNKRKNTLFIYLSTSSLQ